MNTGSYMKNTSTYSLLGMCLNFFAVATGLQINNLKASEK
jgi:hypothetical protein